MDSLIGLLRVDSYFLSPNSGFYKIDRLDTFMQKSRNRKGFLVSYTKTIFNTNCNGKAVRTFIFKGLQVR